MSRSHSGQSVAWLPFAVGGAALAVYTMTAAPAVGLIDSGELSAGCYLLNILHPTGYPLFTLIGRLASLVPLGSVANRMAGLSATLSAIGIGLFVVLCRRLGFSEWAAAGAGLVLAFSIPVWSVSTDAEVHSLTLVLGVLVWLAVVNADDVRGLLLLSYIAGLALTNHMSATSIVIGAGVGSFVGFGRRILRRLPASFAMFLLGVSLYLFLLIRARAGPALAWGNPVSLERLWWHVTGKQYQVWMFSLSASQVLANASRGVMIFGRSLAWVLIPAVVAGAVTMLRKRRAVAGGLLTAATLSFLYATNYSIPDIEAYFLPAMLSLAVFAAAGIDMAVRHWKSVRIAVFLPAAATLIIGYGSMDRHDHYVALDMARNTLASADSGAVILTDWWDLYAPIYYLQHIEGLRTDICVVDRELVRRSWYLDYLNKNYSWLMERLQREKEEYASYLEQFEHGRLRNPAAIQRCYIAMLRGFLIRGDKRPTYVTFADDGGPDARQLLVGMDLKPVGLLFRVGGDTVLPRFNYAKLRIRVPRRGLDDRTRANLLRYRNFIARRVQALEMAGRSEEAMLLWYSVDEILGPVTRQSR